MASVALNAVWINLASDLAQYVTYGSMGSMGASSSSGAMASLPRSDTLGTTGAVRQYANGNLRLVTTVGVAEVYQTTLRAVSSADVATLDSWFNQIVLMRDRVGRRVWGVFSGRTVGDYPRSDAHDYTLTVSALTFVEGV